MCVRLNMLMAESYFLKSALIPCVYTSADASYCLRDKMYVAMRVISVAPVFKI